MARCASLQRQEGSFVFRIAPSGAARWIQYRPIDAVPLNGYSAPYLIKKCLSPQPFKKLRQHLLALLHHRPLIESGVVVEALLKEVQY